MAATEKINNNFYHHLGKLWYEAKDDPVALLRAENKVKVPWIVRRLKRNSRVLDVGCGGGFLSNALALAGHEVTGVDLSEDALRIAHEYDRTKKVKYLTADAYHLPFPDESFDAVSAMDFLEHVERPDEVIQEISRVLKKDGLFFYHTFNRHFFSWLIVIKLVEWLIPKTPKNMHVLKLFIRPQELKEFCLKASMKVKEQVGLRPVLRSIPWTRIFSGEVPSTFSFKLTKSSFLSYMGMAKKVSN